MKKAKILGETVVVGSAKYHELYDILKALNPIVFTEKYRRVKV